MTLLVRDEEDILENNICFHLNNGVDFIVAVDNGSIDKTPNILEKYQKKGVLSYKVIKKHTYEQATWVSQMAKEAVNEFGATHLFHCDADEFWYPTSGNLKTHLPDNNEVFFVNVINYLPTIDKNQKKFNFKDCKFATINPLPYPNNLNKFVSSKILLYQYPPKIITTNQFLRISAGNHGIICSEPFLKKTANNVFIYHFPVRNYQHFLKRVVKSGKSMINSPIKDPNINWHIRSWYEKYLKGDLSSEYDLLSLRDKKSLRLHLLQGTVKNIKIPRRIRYARLLFQLKYIIKERIFLK